MTIKPFAFVSALSLIAATIPVLAESPAVAAEAIAAAALMPAAAATVTVPQPLEDLQVEGKPAPERSAAERRTANRRAREELRRRFGPSVHVFN